MTESCLSGAHPARKRKSKEFATVVVRHKEVAVFAFITTSVEKATQIKSNRSSSAVTAPGHTRGKHHSAGCRCLFEASCYRNSALVGSTTTRWNLAEHIHNALEKKLSAPLLMLPLLSCKFLRGPMELIIYSPTAVSLFHLFRIRFFTCAYIRVLASLNKCH